MTGEPFHKTGITVPAAVPAPHIRVDAVIKAGDGCFGKDSFRKDFPYFHTKYYNGLTRNDKP